MNGYRECSSCEALYTKSCGCSKGGFADKFVRDPNKTTDSSQRPTQDCPKCGNPVDGLYCRHCALLRKKLKEVWFTICDEHKFFQDFLNTSESSNDDSNVVNAPQEPFVFNQDPGEDSSQSPPHIDHHCCFRCGDSLDGIFCQRCTCKSYGKGAHYGYNCPPKNLQQRINDSMIELHGTFQAWLEQRKDQVVNLDSYSLKPLQCRKIPICYDDDDDEESSTPLRDIIIYELPSCIAITPILSTKEAKSPHHEIYSNPLFDEEIISIKIDPHHFSAEYDLIESLLNQDSSIISSSKIDSLLDDFAEINYENFYAVIESFSPSPISFEDSDPFMEEIDLFLTYDGSIPPGIDSDYSDSEWDNIFPERLLHDDPIPLLNILDFSNVVRICSPSSPIR
nr:hypothetical protein [Tanacetum cinerariifolium]